MGKHFKLCKHLISHETSSLKISTHWWLLIKPIFTLMVAELFSTSSFPLYLSISNFSFPTLIYSVWHSKFIFNFSWERTWNESKGLLYIRKAGKGEEGAVLCKASIPRHTSKVGCWGWDMLTIGEKRHRGSPGPGEGVGTRLFHGTISGACGFNEPKWGEEKDSWKILGIPLTTWWQC